jgi:hypothetical protein
MKRIIVLCAYRPHSGKEAELRTLLKVHVPLLREQELASTRPVTLLRSTKDGTYVEIFEWVSPEASTIAHEKPKVLELWSRLEAVADFLPLQSLNEAAHPFAHFELIEDLEPG